MYQCHLNIYLTGHQSKIHEIIKEMLPLEHFSHDYFISDNIEKAQAGKADVIFADLQDTDINKTLQILIKEKKKETELFVFADTEQIALLTDYLPDIRDIWTLPMSDEEIRFRFLRWQQTYKMSMDFWQTNHYFESTINSIPNLIWYKNKDGVHLKVNDSFCETVGKTKEQVQGQKHAYIWNVEHDDPACIESELEVMNTRKTCVSEEVIQTGDGTRLLTTYKSPLYNVDGNVMGTVGVGIDVTQERAYEQELITKSHTLESLFTTIDCGIICHTLDGSQIISINRAALNILGYKSQEELMERGFDTVAPSVIDEDVPKLREAIRKLKNEGDSTNVEYRVQHENGDILYVTGNLKIIKEGGHLLCQRFLLDCTAQKLQEKKNEKHQLELVNALGIDYNLIFFFDLDTGLGMPLRINDSDNNMFKSTFIGSLSFKESMELYIEQFVYEDDKELFRELSNAERLKKELSEKKVSHINFRVMLNNEMKYYQMKAVQTGNWDENTTIILGFRSVDEEIRGEMEQKSLLEDALLQANNANKAKSTFLSNMSHDIRTPMNAIVGFTSLALTHIDNKEQVHEYLNKIMTSGNHLLSLINDVLDMSRIESGKMHLEEKACSLPDILHGLRNMVQAEVNAKQLELYIDTIDIIDEDIFCDKLRLNQILLNLLSNAIKYTPSGGTINLRIAEKSNTPDGFANYEFNVKDSGIGMSEEFVKHIFEPFEREESSTINGIQGTGLGMAITKNIVDMMNGTISVKSEQGVGTEFTVFLSFRINSGKKESQSIPELMNCRALVVAHDFNSCDSVSYMLQQIGLRAEWTLSGKEAVLRTRQAVMRDDDFSVYIINWLLPDMSGIEATRRIKKETGGNVPIIILSAYDWTDIEEEALEAGVTAFCSKPLFLSELRSCLYSIVNAHSNNKDKNKTDTKKLRSGRILLTEDIDLNQEIASTILNEAGFSTEIASNGQIAVDMLKNSEPGYYQLVLMDIQMPVMNGYDATKAIRRLENKEIASIPIIAMTANAFEEDKQQALNCGMNGHISKPIDIKKLFETLDRIISYT